VSDLLALVGAALERPAEGLVELERRPLRLVFLPGDYVTLTLRDRGTREVFDVTVSPGTGEVHRREDLRSRDREAAARVVTLDPGLRSLLLRHPGLDALLVRVTSDSRSRRLTASAADVVSLAREPGVRRVELLAEPEVPDSTHS